MEEKEGEEKSHSLGVVGLGASLPVCPGEGGGPDGRKEENGVEEEERRAAAGMAVEEEGRALPGEGRKKANGPVW